MNSGLKAGDFPADFWLLKAINHAEKGSDNMNLQLPLKERILDSPLTSIPEQKKKPLLDVRELSVSFVQYTRGLRQIVLTVITGLSIEIEPGKILAVVGSSGSGKSLLAHAILGILPVNARVSGAMFYDGEELTPKRQAQLRGRDISFIPQSINFLDPLMKVGPQVRATVRHRNRRHVQRDIFARYHLDRRVEQLYPFQLSGGMARRVLLLGAMVNDARLVIADEPTPGLQPEIVREALAHLRQLADEGRAVMLITHDIGAALDVADYIAVFYAGTTVEIAPVKDFSGNGETLRHPYSKILWRALPQNDFMSVPGFQPAPGSLPAGCLFSPRCGMAEVDCFKKRPSEQILRGGKVRCNHAT